MTHLLQTGIQKALSQLYGGGYSNGDAPQGSYL
jgi:hypothetical protein